MIQNFEMLGIGESDEVVDMIDLFEDERYPGLVLMDLDNTLNRPELRGLYGVNMETYDLLRISSNPLRKFI